MSTYTSIHQTPLFRLQAQMVEHRLVRSFRDASLSEGALPPREAKGRVKQIRHWQNGRFVATPLLA